jgi:hypothetical protein
MKPEGTGRFGHKTLIDGSHVPLTEGEADALWKAIEAARERRAQAMPTAESALSAMCDAKQRMQELGWWQGGGLKVKRGDECAVAEFGSTGIWTGWIDTEGKYLHYCDCVADPRKAWLKPLSDLTPEERAHMDKCNEWERQASEAEHARYAAMSEVAVDE